MTESPLDPASAAARVLARVRAVAGAGAVVEAYGPSVYAPAHASDVDVLVSDDDPTRLAAALGPVPIPTLPPRMHGTLEGVAVDVTVVTGDDDLARAMRAGPRDAALLVAYLRDHGRAEAFDAAWPHVRRFVRARGLGHNGLGWFGSFGWALLLAAPLVTDPALRAARPGWTGKPCAPPGALDHAAQRRDRRCRRDEDLALAVIEGPQPLACASWAGANDDPAVLVTPRACQPWRPESSRRRPRA